MPPVVHDDEAELFGRIRELVLAARRTVACGVNLVQVRTNYEIGRYIVEYEQQGKLRAKYGQEILKNLSGTLADEFGRGFSLSNLKLMRQFFLEFKGETAWIGQNLSGQSGKEKSQTVSGQLQRTVEWLMPSGKAPFSLSWSHYILLLGIRNLEERRFYEIEATEQQWTLRELRRQVASGLYERLALSRDKRGVRRLAQKGQIIAKPQDILKEPYILEFLGLEERTRYSESDLEQAIINQLERFLLELGKGFLFEARQRRFTFDEDHFFVDLVFYNRLLRCYVLIDLKLDKLTHQDLGQMQMYINYYDRHVKLPRENSTIGILLCKRKKDAIVELTLPKDANIHAREYQLYLPSKEELKQKLNEWIENADEKQGNG